MFVGLGLCSLTLAWLRYGPWYVSEYGVPVLRMLKIFAYFWLAFQLGVDWHPHIGRLSTGGCQRVVRVMRLAKRVGYGESVAMWRRGEKLVDIPPPTEVECSA